jgi:hypothetical protein
LIYLQFGRPEWIDGFYIQVIDLPQFGDLGNDFEGAVGTATGKFEFSLKV